MKKFRLFCLCLLCLPAVGVSAQVMDKVLDILGTDSLSAVAGVKTDTDSVTLDKVREELAAARLNEANLRMEIEQMRLVTYAADSVKLARQKQRIDSLRHQTKGMPVVVEEPSAGDSRPSSGPRTCRTRLRPWASVSTCIPTQSISKARTS